MGSANLIYLAKANRPVVTKEKPLNARTSCGENKVQAGKGKTWAEVCGNYSGVKHGATDLFLNICTICSYLQVIQNLLAGKAMIVRLDISSESSDQSSDFRRWSRPALFEEFLTSSAVSCRGFLMSFFF